MKSHYNDETHCFKINREPNEYEDRKVFFGIQGLLLGTLVIFPWFREQGMWIYFWYIVSGIIFLSYASAVNRVRSFWLSLHLDPTGECIWAFMDSNSEDHHRIGSIQDVVGFSLISNTSIPLKKNSNQETPNCLYTECILTFAFKDRTQIDAHLVLYDIKCKHDFLEFVIKLAKALQIDAIRIDENLEKSLMLSAYYSYTELKDQDRFIHVGTQSMESFYSVLDISYQRQWSPILDQLSQSILFYHPYQELILIEKESSSEVNILLNGLNFLVFISSAFLFFKLESHSQFELITLALGLAMVSSLIRYYKQREKNLNQKNKKIFNINLKTLELSLTRFGKRKTYHLRCASHLRFHYDYHLEQYRSKKRTRSVSYYQGRIEIQGLPMGDFCVFDTIQNTSLEPIYYGGLRFATFLKELSGLPLTLHTTTPDRCGSPLSEDHERENLIALTKNEHIKRTLDEMKESSDSLNNFRFALRMSKWISNFLGALIILSLIYFITRFRFL